MKPQVEELEDIQPFFEHLEGIKMILKNNLKDSSIFTFYAKKLDIAKFYKEANILVDEHFNFRSNERFWHFPNIDCLLYYGGFRGKEILFSYKRYLFDEEISVNNLNFAFYRRMI